MIRRISGLFLALVLTSAVAYAQSSTLDLIRERGRVRVGTTGDYRPFTFLDPVTGQYEGFDIEAARALGDALGVEVEFVSTTWSTLSDGILEGHYDIGMGGITRTLERLMRVGMTEAYVELGKCPLIRASDKGRFRSLADVDRPGVRIGVNPGGTNETFVRSNVSRAEIVVIPNNLEIPGAVIAGDVDVMITDNVEAVLVASERPELYAVSPNEPLTHDEIGYMVRRDDQPFLNYLNLWLRQRRASGALAKLDQRWLGR